MRSWLSKRLFDAAVWLDWDTIADRAKLVVLVDMNLQDALMLSLGEPKKRGRPAKADTWRTHAWVPGEEAAPKKRGRPLGSKNKPKAQP